MISNLTIKKVQKPNVSSIIMTENEKDHDQSPIMDIQQQNMQPIIILQGENSNQIFTNFRGTNSSIGMKRHSETVLTHADIKKLFESNYNSQKVCPIPIKLEHYDQ